MAINLATPIIFANGTRLVLQDVRPDDDNQIMSVKVELRTTAATDVLATWETVIIRNGKCDQITRGIPAAGTTFDIAIVKLPDALTLPTGFTDALTAWKGGANNGARKTALETYMLSAAIIDATLTP